jgi:hypothetical protein
MTAVVAAPPDPAPGPAPSQPDSLASQAGADAASPEIRNGWPDAQQTSHLLAIHARLSAAEQRVAQLVVTRMTPEVRAQAQADKASDSTASVEFVRRTRAFMARMATGNRIDALRILADYGDGSAISHFPDRTSLASAIAAGRLRPLPAGASSIRVRPRLVGPHPIGELDRDFQRVYVAARPAAIECLMRIGASLPGGTLDLTSLVRHEAYQHRLSRTNLNATRQGSMHTTGLAFDISVLNVSPATATAIGDILLAMRAAGDLYFIAETRQLVFHVVPAASRLAEWRALRDTVDAAGEPARLAAVTPMLTPVSGRRLPPGDPLRAGVVAGGPGGMARVGGLRFGVGALLRGRRNGH